MTVIETIAAVRADGRSRMTRCAAHDDRAASLSVSRGRTQPIVLRCHAGCSIEAVLTAAGLTVADISDAHGNHVSAAASRTTTYPLRDHDGQIVALHERIDQPGAHKRYIWRRTDGAPGLGGRHTADLPLYGTERLSRLAGGSIVVVTEGERACAALHARGLAAVGTVTGASGTPSDDVLRVLSSYRVRLWPDADPPGQAHMARIAARLAALGHSDVAVIAWPDAPAHGDAADYNADPQPLIAAAEPISADASITPGATTTNMRSDDGDRVRPSQATRLVDLALAADVELWHAPSGDPYITLHVDGHREHHVLRAREVRDWLARRHHAETRCAPNASALADALVVLAGMARYDGAEHAPAIRIGGDGRAAVYLDLGEANWQAVEITRTGWRVVADPPVRLVRSRGMLPLPLPMRRAGALEILRDLLPISETDTALTIGWLVGALSPQGPYPLLAYTGEQGSGKSTAARMVRRLVDPHVAELRAEPRTIDDVMIAASRSRVVALDNLSHLSPWLSDALCRLSTGGALTRRELYTDADEVILEAQRPTILTSITDVVTRGDLLDRAITVTLPELDERDRLPEAELWRQYDLARPAMLGSLCDAVACALQRRDDLDINALPRLADWALWVTAAEPALDSASGSILAAYRQMRGAAIEATLDGDPLAVALRSLPRPWTSTASELLTHVTPQGRAPRGWPESPRALSSALRRLTPGLRRVGLEISTKREAHSGRRLITIDTGDEPSPSSPSSLGPDLLRGSGDARVTQTVGMGTTVTVSSPERTNKNGVCDEGDDGDTGISPSWRTADVQRI